MRRIFSSLLWAVALVTVSIIGTHLTQQGQFLWHLFAEPVWAPMAFVLVSTGRFTESATEPVTQVVAVTFAVLVWWAIILVGRLLLSLIVSIWRRSW
jgi:hypothetical protein